MNMRPTLINPRPIVKQITNTNSNAKLNVSSYVDQQTNTMNLITPELVFDVIRGIKDPEHPYTLEQLNVVAEDRIKIYNMDQTELNPNEPRKDDFVISIEFTPTVPHCSLASLIGLCIRVKLQRELELFSLFKLDIIVTPGSHSTDKESNTN